MKKPIFKKQIFKGKLLNLYIEKQRFPNGYVGQLEIIKHPGAVLIVPFLSKDKIVLIKQYRPVIGSYIWELPAGTLHGGEQPLTCAKRELIEETGYYAAQWKARGSIYPAPGYTTEKIRIYEARRLRKVDSAIQEDEVIAVNILRKKDVTRLFKAGKIVDAKTICAFTHTGIL